jgi:short-subunit dehydrogenase
MRELRGKVVVVTGAGSGIGRALALQLASEGSRLALVDVDAEGLDETCHLARGHGAEIRCYAVDVAERVRMEELALDVARDLGNADVVINNAGVGSTGRVQDLQYATLAWTMQVNFWGVVHGTKAFLPMLLEQPEAAVVNVASVFGLMGAPGQAAYCASKFAVRGFTEALQQDLHGTPVAATLVLPGGVRTQITRRSRSDLPVSAEALRRGKAEFERHLTTPPERAARAILQGVREKKRRVLIGADALVLDRLVRWFPERHAGLVRRKLQENSIWEDIRAAPAALPPRATAPDRTRDRLARSPPPDAG